MKGKETAEAETNCRQLVVILWMRIVPARRSANMACGRAVQMLMASGLRGRLSGRHWRRRGRGRRGRWRTRSCRGANERRGDGGDERGIRSQVAGALSSVARRRAELVQRALDCLLDAVIEVLHLLAPRALRRQRRRRATDERAKREASVWRH